MDLGYGVRGLTFLFRITFLCCWVIDGWNSLGPNETVTTLIHYAWWNSALAICVPYV
jgi:hypothetical protein